MLSEEASAEPGQWRTARAEYLREIMDAVADPNIREVCCMKGSQIGWTEVILNTLGRYIEDDPCPIMVIQPTIEMAEAWSKDRLAPMLRDTPSLRGKVRDPRSRRSENQIRHKAFPGGHVTMVGANAPAGLASRPIRIVLADEIDRYPASAGTEGDPLKLAAKRQITFWNRKTLLGSTPTTKELSAIAREWERSDKRRFFVPCPACGHEQFLHWAQVRWDKVEVSRDQFEHDPSSAKYHCEACDAGWDDGARWRAVSRGSWRATAPFRGMAGFHVPGLISSWLTMSDVVKEFLDAQGSPELLQVWTNTVLGDVWEEKGESVDAEGLPGRAENYDSLSIPDAVGLLTAGVDVQDDRLEVQVIGWGEKEEAWPCLYEIIHGDPAGDDVWEMLDGLLKERFQTESGRSMRLASMCVDFGGHHGAQVLRFTQKRHKANVFAVKGQAGQRLIWPRKPSRAKGKQLLYIIGVDAAKEAIYGRLKNNQPGPFYIHFPMADGFEQVYFDQLTSEQRITRYVEGRPKHEWRLKTKGARNEALDTFVYAFAAMKSFPARMLKPLPVPEGRPTTPAPIEMPMAFEREEPPPAMSSKQSPGGGFRRQASGQWLTRRNGWMK